MQILDRYANIQSKLMKKKERGVYDPETKNTAVTRTRGRGTSSGSPRERTRQLAVERTRQLAMERRASLFLQPRLHWQAAPGQTLPLV